MEILEAFDLSGTLCGAAELAGCDHKTVAHWVRAREQAGGGLPVATRLRPRVDEFAAKNRGVGRWVARQESGRTSPISGWSLWATWVRSARRAARSLRPSGLDTEHGRRTRPWVVEPG
jgi:hypothetical protein